MLGLLIEDHSDKGLKGILESCFSKCKCSYKEDPIQMQILIP